MNTMEMLSNMIKTSLIFSWKFLNFPIKIYNFHLPLMALVMVILSLRYLYGKNLAISNLMNMLYNHIEDLCHKHLHTTSTLVVAFFMTIFLYVAILNILSVFGFYSINGNPYFMLNISFFLFAIFVITGIYMKQHRFILDLCPSSTPLIMKPLIILLELVSICLKPISSSIRLILNLIIGHMCIHILEILSKKSFGLFFISFFIGVFIKCIEVLMSFLQAYIFTNMFLLLFKSLNH